MIEFHTFGKHKIGNKLCKKYLNILYFKNSGSEKGFNFDQLCGRYLARRPPRPVSISSLSLEYPILG